MTTKINIGDRVRILPSGENSSTLAFVTGCNGIVLGQDSISVRVLVLDPPHYPAGAIQWFSEEDLEVLRFLVSHDGKFITVVDTKDPKLARFAYTYSEVSDPRYKSEDDDFYPFFKAARDYAVEHELLGIIPEYGEFYLIKVGDKQEIAFFSSRNIDSEFQDTFIVPSRDYGFDGHDYPHRNVKILEHLA